MPDSAPQSQEQPPQVPRRLKTVPSCKTLLLRSTNSGHPEPDRGSFSLFAPLFVHLRVISWCLFSLSSPLLVLVFHGLFILFCTFRL